MGYGRPVDPQDIDALAARTGFAGVVSVDRAGEVEFARAYGLAHRGWAVPNEVGTRFALASGTKGFTALTVLSLVADGSLDLATPARSVLGDDLPLVGDAVTVEHLLSHRSGIGDYVDEEADHDIADYVLPVPVHELAGTEAYLAVLGGYPAKFPPGERFAYCNSGYVVLALIAERVSGVPFADLVRDRVSDPAGLSGTGYLRSDELPGGVALGYLDEGPRTNVFHLPVLGSGDGGLYSTAGDVSALWRALFAGRIVAPRWVAEAVRRRSDRYGLGFWLDAGGVVYLEGYDAGVSFRSRHDPATGTTWTVVSNTSDGAWPIARALAG
jgi:CubicO group peptidase (beta-lactamase class C family)